MGTRSLTIVRDEDGTDILTMYGQWDGMPEHYGRDLVSFLAPFKIVNGIGSYEAQNQANGAECLAAQIVAHFKRRKPKTKDTPATGPIGSFYIYPNGTKDVGQEYTYVVKVNHIPLGDSWIDMEILDGNWKQMVQGNPVQMRAWIMKQIRSKASRKAAKTRQGN